MSSEKASAPKSPKAARRFGVPALVALLLAARCPATVAKFVVAVIVNAVQRVFRGWAPANISQEGFVGLLPLATDGNAAPSVTGIPLMFRVATPLPHVDPCHVLGRPSAALGVAVRGQRLGAFVAVVAAAAHGLARRQVRRLDDSVLSALAVTVEVRSWPLFRPEHHGKPPETLSAQVSVCHRNQFYQKRGHVAQ